MFNKSLDAKSTFEYNGIEIKDLTESIYSENSTDFSVMHSYYRVSKDMEMRPDKISYALYGDISYAEIVLKESGIDNPFSIQENDYLLVPPLNTVYQNIKDDDEFTNSAKASSNYDLIANYHKYIDKNKVPTEIGSDTNKISIPGESSSIDPNLQAIEPNLANKGKSGIFVENGKIYFGNSISSSASDVTDISGTNDIDSPLVDCAKNGVSLGQFLNATIKNSIK